MRSPALTSILRALPEAPVEPCDKGPGQVYWTGVEIIAAEAVEATRRYLEASTAGTKKQRTARSSRETRN
jgi:hypothetical protein